MAFASSTRVPTYPNQMYNLKRHSQILLPCNRTTIGMVSLSSLAAAIIPFAMTSHLIIPPNMLTNIA